MPGRREAWRMQSGMVNTLPPRSRSSGTRSGCATMLLALMISERLLHYGAGSECAASAGAQPVAVHVLRLRGSGGWDSVSTRTRKKGGREREVARGSRRDSRGRRTESSSETEEEIGEKNVPLGKHLEPVLRPKRSETQKPVATVVSMHEAVARKRERERLRARAEDQGAAAAPAVLVTVREGFGAEAGGGVLPITEDELLKTSKGKLLKLAKQHGLRVKCEDKAQLTNKDIRRALAPFVRPDSALEMPSRDRGRRKTRAGDRKRGGLLEKSRYLASMWVDGEERSVYGQGHPKDSDFVQWAEECVEELEARERVNPTGPTRSRKERKEMVHEVALKFSDEYFIKVLTGEIKVGPGASASLSLPGDELEVSPLADAAAAQPDARPAEADDSVAAQVRSMWDVAEHDAGEHVAPGSGGEQFLEEGGVGRGALGGIGKGAAAVRRDEHEAIRERWDAVELRDFSLYSVTQLNEKLHTAAADGHVAAISVLAAAGARVNGILASSSPQHLARGWTPLFTAAYLGHYGAAERLLQLGANVSRCTELGCTPLDCVVTGPTGPDESAAMVELLAAYGADLSRYNRAGWQPVHAAAFFGRCEMLVRLVELGADVAAVTLESNRSALDLALANRRNLTAVVIRELLAGPARGGGRWAVRRVERRRASSPQPRDLNDDEAELSVGDYSEVMSSQAIVAAAPKLDLWEESSDPERLAREIEGLFPSNSRGDVLPPHAYMSESSSGDNVARALERGREDLGMGNT